MCLQLYSNYILTKMNRVQEGEPLLQKLVYILEDLVLPVTFIGCRYLLSCFMET